MWTKFQLNIPIPERDNIGFWANDRSANGRINAWNYAINVANDRFTGGGMESWEWWTFELYAPVTNILHSSHSIYFGVLADHGRSGARHRLASSSRDTTLR